MTKHIALTVGVLFLISCKSASPAKEAAPSAKLPPAEALPPPAKDSPWKPLFNGRDFNGFNVWTKHKGVVPMDQQKSFVIENGTIYVPGKDISHLFTLKEYSHYRLRFDFRFGTGEGSNNAGVVVHWDVKNTLNGKSMVVMNRVTSIEVGLWRPEDFLFGIAGWWQHGPIFSSMVEPGSVRFLPKSQGGVPFTSDPWCKNVSSTDPASSRQITSALPKPEKPPGEWNHGEIVVNGDSVEAYLNGQLRAAAWDFKAHKDRMNQKSPTEVYNKGGIAIQSEGHEIWYRNIEIMELDPKKMESIKNKYAY